MRLTKDASEETYNAQAKNINILLMLCKINDPDDWIDRVHHKWYLWSHFEGRYYWMWTAVIIRSLITHLTVITSRYGVFPYGPLMVGPINNFDHCSRGNKGFNWCKRITDSNQGLVLAWNRLGMIQSPRSNISTFVVRILTHIKSQGKKIRIYAMIPIYGWILDSDVNVVIPYLFYQIQQFKRFVYVRKATAKSIFYLVNKETS